MLSEATAGARSRRILPLSFARNKCLSMKSYYVYLLLCADFSFYVGITNDVERRLAQHNIGWDPR
jgi:hypothetical protein